MATSCVQDTNSIALNVTTGVLTATLKADPATNESPNALAVSATGVYVPSDQWTPIPANLVYSSTTGSGDGACYVCTTSSDLSSYVTPGAHVRLKNGGIIKYFIVVAITSTQITLWGSASFTVANSPITLPYFSLAATSPGMPTGLSRCAAPPAVAYDGMPIQYIAASAEGIDWDMVYESSDSSFHWHAQGGPALYVTGGITAVWSGFTDITGATITVPRAGDYEVVASAHGGASTQGVARVRFLVDGVALDTGEQEGNWTNYALAYRATNCAAGAVLKLQANSNAGASLSYTGYLLVRPTRFN